MENAPSMEQLLPSREPRLRKLCVLALTLLACRNLPAQIEVGTQVPNLSLTSLSGQDVRISVKEGRLNFAEGDSEATDVKALMLHFFQPDCLQCQVQLQALDVLQRQSGPGIKALAVAYRGDMAAVKKLRERAGLQILMALASPDPTIAKIAAGDAFGIAGQDGVFRFAQAGFGAGDEKYWREVAGDLAEGRLASKSTVDRTRLKAQDRFPVIDLPSLRNGRPMSLRGEEGALIFTNDDGTRTKPRAAIFFFSRY